VPGKLDFEVTFCKVLSNVEWGFSGFLFYISIVFTFSPSSSSVKLVFVISSQKQKTTKSVCSLSLYLFVKIVVTFTFDVQCNISCPKLASCCQNPEILEIKVCW